MTDHGRPLDGVNSSARSTATTGAERSWGGLPHGSASSTVRSLPWPRATELGNPVWGPLMRAGNDESLFARQVERYADVPAPGPGATNANSCGATPTTTKGR